MLVCVLYYVQRNGFVASPATKIGRLSPGEHEVPWEDNALYFLFLVSMGSR